MNKLFTFILLSCIAFSGYSQCTPDDKYKDEEMGSYPTPEEGLEKAEVGKGYEQVLSLVIPEKADNFELEKGVLKDMKGLPDGFTYECGEPDCTYEPGFHCLLISGTAKEGQVGVYDLSFVIDVYLKGAPVATPVNYDDYKLEIIAASSVNDINSIAFGVSQNSPNPFSNETAFKISSLTQMNLDFSIIDLVGKEVFSDKISVSPGETNYQFSSDNLNKGIYLYRVTDGLSSITKRMIIK